MVIKSDSSSKQYIEEDSFLGGVVHPFVNFQELLDFFYANTYHRKCLRIKAGLLSQVLETNLDKFLPDSITPKEFLYQIILDLEIYGNSFIEKSGTESFFKLYWLPAHEARVDREGNIFQYKGFKSKKLEGHHIKYHSPRSRFYGEADYLATLKQILSTKQADEFNNAYFDNGAMPNMAITFNNSEPSKAQKEAFKQFFKDNYQGVKNAFRNLIIWTGKTREDEKSANVEIQKLAEVTDLSFKELKAVNRDEIITAHDVPPRLVGVVSAGQLGGGSELIGQLHTFNEVGLKPKREFIETKFEQFGIEVKLKDLDTTNFKDDSDVVTNLINAGVINVAEAREILGWAKNGS